VFLTSEVPLYAPPSVKAAESTGVLRVGLACALFVQQRIPPQGMFSEEELEELRQEAKDESRIQHM